ncbi:MAG: MCE family protein [Planctomycetes bacterium]|nr:MCE family protein [Planctomycetota bacterium]
MVNTATNYWKLGLFVVCGLILILGTFFWLGANRFGRRSVAAVSYFDESVNGLEVGSPVKFRGVQLGTVSAITIAPNQRYVAVHMKIFQEELDAAGLTSWKSNTQTPDERLRTLVGTMGITGAKYILVDVYDTPPESKLTFDFELPEATMNLLSVGSTLQSLEAGAMATVDQLPAILEKITRVLDDTHELLAAVDAKRLNDELARLLETTEQQVRDLRVKELRDDLGSLFDEIRNEVRALELAALRDQVSGLIGDARGSVQSLNELVTHLDDPEGSLHGTLAEVRTLAAALREEVEAIDLAATGKSVRGAADAFATTARGTDRLTQDLAQTLRAFRDTLATFQRLAELLERDPGAILRGREASGSRRGG